MNTTDFNRILSTLQALSNVWAIWEDRRNLRWYHLLTIVLVICAAVVITALRFWLDSWDQIAEQAIQDKPNTSNQEETS